MNRREEGFTLIEMMIVVAIIAVVASMVLPNLLAALISGSEAAAISNLRTLSTACELYRSRNGALPPDLASMLPAGLIDPVLASGTKGDYVFTYGSGVDTWSCNADPANPTGGERYF
ncbi:MAG: type II secretion system protein, partial [Planctomycetota bacterium]